jgi:hypothetical protein
MPKARTHQTDVAQLFSVDWERREPACASAQWEWVAFTAPCAATGKAGKREAACALM